MQESKETIGQRLKKIRLSRQISIEKAAEATRIRVQYIQALEADNYSAMSSAAQGRGFLRLYAGFLDLDLEAAMAELRESGAENAPSEPRVPEVVTPTPVSPQTPPAPIMDAKPAARPFWARLLRRSAPESSGQMEPAPEVASKIPEEPAAEPESEIVRVKTPVAKVEDKKKVSK